jgi:hypothetical protein
MTKQRRWQIKMVRKGKCKICGAPAVTKFHCEKHRLAVNTRAREALHKRDSAKRRYPAAEYSGGTTGCGVVRKAYSRSHSVRGM